MAEVFSPSVQGDNMNPGCKKCDEYENMYSGCGSKCWFALRARSIENVYDSIYGIVETRGDCEDRCSELNRNGVCPNFTPKKPWYLCIGRWWNGREDRNAS